MFGNAVEPVLRTVLTNGEVGMLKASGLATVEEIFGFKGSIRFSLATLHVSVVLIQFLADQFVKSICKAAPVVKSALQVPHVWPSTYKSRSMMFE